MRPFLHKMWLKDWFPSVPNGLVIKKIFHLTYIYGTYARTFEQEDKKVSSEFKYLKLPCPKFKRGRQMANVTARV